MLMWFTIIMANGNDNFILKIIFIYIYIMQVARPGTHDFLPRRYLKRRAVCNVGPTAHGGRNRTLSNAAGCWGSKTKCNSFVNNRPQTAV